MELLKGLTMLWVTSDALTYPLKEATGVDLSLKRLGKYNCGALGDPKVLLFPPQPTCVEYPTWRPLICFIKTNLKFYTILRFETIKTDKAESPRLQFCPGFKNSFSIGKSDVLFAK